MNHRVFGRKLSRTHNERRRLLQGLARDMFLHGQIRTTLAKAKAVQPMIERLITKGKNADGADIVQIRKVLADKKSVDKLMADSKTRFSGRTSGHTRIYKTGPRVSDNARMALLSFVDASVETQIIVPEKPVTEPVIKKRKPVRSRKPKK